MQTNNLTIGQYIELKKSMMNHTIDSESCVLFDGVRKIFEDVLKKQIMCADCAQSIGCEMNLRPWRAIHTCFVPKAVIDDEPYEYIDSDVVKGNL